MRIRWQHFRNVVHHFSLLCQLFVWSRLWYRGLEIRVGICRPLCLKLNWVNGNSQKWGLEKTNPNSEAESWKTVAWGDTWVAVHNMVCARPWRTNGPGRNPVEWLSTVNLYMVFADPGICTARPWNLGSAKVGLFCLFGFFLTLHLAVDVRISEEPFGVSVQEVKKKNKKNQPPKEFSGTYADFKNTFYTSAI